MKDLFDYQNYREFLKEKYDREKSLKSCFSARYFAKKANISSPSYFNMVVTGKRQLTLEYAEKFARALNLDSLEKQFLYNTVKLERENNQEERYKILKRLDSLRNRTMKASLMRNKHVEILSDVTTLSIYVLSQNNHFEFDSKWISKKLNISDIPLVEKKMRALLDSKLWSLENGKITPLAPKLVTGDYLEEEYLRKTHENILTRAIESLKKQSSAERIALGNTFLCKKEDIPKIKEKIDKFRRELEDDFEDLSAEDVFQLHISLFNLKDQEQR